MLGAALVFASRLRSDFIPGVVWGDWPDPALVPWAHLVLPSTSESLPWRCNSCRDNKLAPVALGGIKPPAFPWGEAEGGRAPSPRDALHPLPCSSPVLWPGRDAASASHSQNSLRQQNLPVHSRVYHFMVISAWEGVGWWLLGPLGALLSWLHSWKRWHRGSAHLWKGLGAPWGVCACSEGGLAQGKVPPARRERFCWPGGGQDGEQLPGGQLPGSGAASPPSCRADTSELARHKRTFETGRAEKSRAAGSVPRVSGLVSLRAACSGMIYKLQTFPGLFL